MLDEIQTVRRTKPQSADTEAPAQEMSRKAPMKKKILRAAGMLLVLAVTAVAVYSSYELYIIKKPDYQQKMLEKQTADITNTVGRLIELPEGTPQIATVTDAATLKENQPFFDKAQNGDQVLVFQTEAILYRPSLNKIINVAPVTNNQAPSVGSGQQGAVAPDTAAPKTPAKK